jgi:hypothetical protein
MKLPKKIWGIPLPFAIVMALALIYACIYAGPTRLVLLARTEARKDPSMAVIPIPLSDMSVSAAQGTTLTFFGYRFEVPWQVEVKRNGKFGVVFISQSGEEAVVFLNPAENQGPLKGLRKNLGSKVGYMGRFYGPQSVQSDYDLLRATLNASPTQLSIVFPWSKEVYAATLLIVKGAESKELEAGAYSFETEQLRGFQFGSPTRAKNVHVEAFDAEDQKFEFFFGSKSGPNGGMTQPDINRVLQTLRPAPASQQ